MKSIRNQLIVTLLMSTLVIWCVSAWLIYGGSQQTLQRALDARLQESANMIKSLASSNNFANNTQPYVNDLSLMVQTERQLACQIWSIEGNLLSSTDNAPASSLVKNNQDGFSEIVSQGVLWRVYSVTDVSRGIRVMVGDSITMRRNLMEQILLAVLIPASVMLPVLLVLILLWVHYGLQPLGKLHRLLVNKSGEDLTPVPDIATREIQPLIKAINQLLDKLHTVRDRERNFLAFATHELKTPLAGLRIQAQVALESKDEQQRRDALLKSMSAVDRTSYLVTQLLQMARLESASDTIVRRWIDLEQFWLQIYSEEVPYADIGSVPEAVSGLAGWALYADEGRWMAVLRNLVNNALRYGTAPVTVTLDVEASDRSGVATLVLQDNGPGMRPEDLQRATERFYRGSTLQTGSGLGLAIVALALQQDDAGLQLSNGEQGGLRVEMTVSATRLRHSRQVGE